MRHRFHSLCPYFAMFPEEFVRKHLAAWSDIGAVVFDPFCGRGTTLFESLLNGRAAAGCDTNLVAVCVSRAKCNAPIRDDVSVRLRDLRRESCDWVTPEDVADDVFFNKCYHPSTLREITFLRHVLRWAQDDVDCFIAALMLGSLHGESHRSELYLSNRMPRTISTKPEYSIRWWTENRLTAPKRDVFAILEHMLSFRFTSEPPRLKGSVAHADARTASAHFPSLWERVDLIVTSPPYLDVTSFEEDQWLRLWFLGAEPRPKRTQGSDDRHRSAAKYWSFLREVWDDTARLVHEGSRIVVRIGGKLSFDECASGLEETLSIGLNGRVRLEGAGASSSIKGGQIRAFRPGATGTIVEHDFVFRVT